MEPDILTNKNAIMENETLNTIYTRRAIRKFKDVPLSKEIIEKIIDAGRMAPSAINMQPWKFYVVTDKEEIQEFSSDIAKSAANAFIKSGIKNIVKTSVSALSFSNKLNFFKSTDPVFHHAPVVIFISAPNDNEWASLDIGMCSQNMMLAAKSLGVDSCPIGFGKFIKNTKSLEKLKIRSDETVLISLVFGYGDENPAIHERKKDNVVFL